MRALDASQGTVSDSLLTAQIGELKLESGALRTRAETANLLVVQLQEQNIGLSTRVEKLNAASEASRLDVEPLNGKLRTARHKFTSVIVEVTRDTNMKEVQQLVMDLA